MRVRTFFAPVHWTTIRPSNRNFFSLFLLNLKKLNCFFFLKLIFFFQCRLVEILPTPKYIGKN